MNCSLPSGLPVLEATAALQRSYRPSDYFEALTYGKDGMKDPQAIKISARADLAPETASRREAPKCRHRVRASSHWQGRPDPLMLVRISSSGTDTSPDAATRPNLTLLLIIQSGSHVGLKGRRPRQLLQCAGSCRLLRHFCKECRTHHKCAHTDLKNYFCVCCAT